MKASHIVAIVLAAVAPTALMLAWTGPTAAPPGNNVSAPINTSSTDQFKPGVVGANIINVYGSSQYINFGNSTGSAGFGFRNNGGVIEVKNSGGNWARLADKPWFVAAGSSSGGWVAQTAGTWIYPTQLTVATGSAAASYTPSNARFTAPEAGLYFCFFQVYKSYAAQGYHHNISTCWNPSEKVCNGFYTWDYTLASQGSSWYDQSTGQMSGLYNLAQGEQISFRIYSNVDNPYAYYAPYSRIGCAKL